MLLTIRMHLFETVGVHMLCIHSFGLKLRTIHNIEMVSDITKFILRQHCVLIVDAILRVYHDHRA